MPRHDVECQRCGTVFESSRTDGARCACGSRRTLWLPKAMTRPVFAPFWHPHLGHEPVYIDSVQTLDRYLKERHGYIAPARRTGKPERLPQTKEEAECVG